MMLPDYGAKLPPDLEALALYHGPRRKNRKRAQGGSKRYDEYSHERPEDESTLTIGSEIFMAWLYGVEWKNSDAPDPDGDIGPGLQVRFTPRPYGHLLLHKWVPGLEHAEDPNTHTFFLVTFPAEHPFFPYYACRGWCYGWEGKLDKYWDSDPEYPERFCFWVPQAILHPFWEIECDRGMHSVTRTAQEELPGDNLPDEYYENWPQTRFNPNAACLRKPGPDHDPGKRRSHYSRRPADGGQNQLGLFNT